MLALSSYFLSIASVPPLATGAEGPAPIRSKEEWYLVTVVGGDFAGLAG